ncbi:hypothetical protein ACRRTK_004489 [Alexandromys fortis]
MYSKLPNPCSFQLGRANILGSLIKAWNDSFNKRKGGGEAPSLSNYNKAVIPLSDSVNV